MQTFLVGFQVLQFEKMIVGKNCADVGVRGGGGNHAKFWLRSVVNKPKIENSFTQENCISTVIILY